MPSYVVQRLLTAFNERGRALSGSRVLVLGLAYKPDTGDARESPAVRVVDGLLRLGAEVRAVDPHVVESAPSTRGSSAPNSTSRRSPRPTPSSCSPTTARSTST